MVRVIAHRGFSGKYPENSIQSIKQALALGVDEIEIDVRITRDNEIVLMHDPWLNRTTNGKGRIFLKTLAELRKYRLKKTNQPIPTLKEVFFLFRNKKTQLNIEIKGVWPAIEVAKLIKKYRFEKKVIISSGYAHSLILLKQMIPGIKTALIFYVSNQPRKDPIINFFSRLLLRAAQFIIINTATSAKADYVNMNYAYAAPWFIKKLHKKGFRVNAWIVNTGPLMKKLIKRKVDGIITDRPDVLQKVIKERKIKINRK